jgi:hypothetical protein
MKIIGSTGKQIDKTHDPKQQADYENTCLIILNRRNRFRAIMSSAVMLQTNQYSVYYPVLDIAPFAITEDTFEHLYRFNKFYSQQHDFSQPWKKIEWFYMEDFVGNSQHVFERLGLTQLRKIQYLQRSPYRYQDSVINIEQCKKWYLELEDFCPLIVK